MLARARSLVASALVALLAGCALLSPPDELVAEPCAPLVASAPGGPLLAGAAKVDITPGRPALLGGFGLLRRSEGVHDRLWARALAVRRGELTLVVVVADVIGLHHHHVEQVRAQLAGRVSPAGLLVASTHDHDGPDTLGLWGLPPLCSGIEPDLLRRVLDGLVLAASRAIDALEPAVLRVGAVQAPVEGISRNKRAPDMIDRTVTAVALDRPDGGPIATLVHFACHPEALGSRNRQVSADFPGPLCAAVEAARPGSVTVFLNGALGGMVTTAQRANTFEELERIGGAIGRLALDALASAPVEPALELAAARRFIAMPVANRRHHLGDLMDLFDGRPFEDGRTLTEVQALRLGPVLLLACPGELLPRPGLELRARIAARAPLVVGLGNDELGYLIHEEDWADPRYHYERTASPGPLGVPAVRRAALLALEDVGALGR